MNIDTAPSSYRRSVRVCVLSHFSHVQLFATLWTVAHHGILQARILECVAIPFSRGILLTQGSNPSQVNLLLSKLPGKP